MEPLESHDFQSQKEEKSLPILKKTMDYINIRSYRYEQDKFALLFLRIYLKIMKQAQYPEFNIFNCSNGWIGNTLHSYSKTIVCIDGEGNDITSDIEQERMKPHLR